MARIKNAIVGYFVGELNEEPTLELGDYITEVNDETDETVEDYAYYSGDGTPETEVTGVKAGYSFVGYYDKENAAMKFIADKKHESGEARKISFKQVLADGTSFTGAATVTDIVATGGAASDFEPFECTIRWNRKPVKTEPTPVVPEG